MTRRPFVTPSTPLREQVLEFKFTLSGESARRMIAAAEQRSKCPGDLVFDVVQAVLEDDLFDAVLDEGDE